MLWWTEGTRRSQWCYSADCLEHYSQTDNTPKWLLFKSAVDNLPIAWKWLVDEQVTKNLHRIAQLRNSTVHRNKQPDFNEIRDLRNRILGINCEGYLWKLSNIKKYMKSKNV